MTEKQKIIGGFFSLELPKQTEYHRGAIHLNSARYCLEYVLRARNYKKIYLPAYICDSVLQPIKRLNIDYVFYSIDEHFAPVFDQVPENDACFFYVNYFGLNTGNVRELCHKMQHLIIDNTQAFFDLPLEHVDTLYSARKFFGVPDGGYLFSNTEKRIDLDRDPSYYRFDALLKQIDLGSVPAEPLFEQNEAYLDTCGMQAMSRTTQRVLRSIDYEHVRATRNANFRYLHKQFGAYNQLNANFSNVNGPMCYPFLIDRGEQLKDYLLKHQIYTDDFWEKVTSRVPTSSFEYHLAKNLIPLPIDQRYNEKDMDAIVRIVRSFLG
ncbi:hypothetical protein [Sporolactobacillus laevolacticus]|uniref:Aminotransferase DegT n=1 Tax=Sporolactobacillus laevolacticus DSM 442 TaxID=1395513 RepID=V6IUK7_9BACL|nr:hypothetical protein [Sporolactobacillus laevolacticus]EST10660.1 hypothetical protein P343_15710 [Sporolactobacillus laevolacticus DSM 442]